MNDLCEYCQKKLGRFWRKDWLWMPHPKYRTFHIIPEIPKGNEISTFMNDRVKVCKECCEDMGIRFHWDE